MKKLSQKLSVAALGLAIASAGTIGNIAAVVAAELSFSTLGSLAGGAQGLTSFSGTFSYNSETLDQDPSQELGVYNLSSWSVDLFSGQSLIANLNETLDLAEGQIVINPEQDKYSLSFFGQVFDTDPAIYGQATLIAGFSYPTNSDTLPSYSPGEFLSGSLSAGDDSDYVTMAKITPKGSTSVPEPSSAAGLGILGFGWFLRKKITSSQSA
ncbi:PEP-CTERM sorting domain-containing protein [Lyngbya aestuarii]|uniref:PEP-CTERM sorting domain-containing protein n=1 Tax=Lyngbya aestuarii TaxID=118322 RepID=UPI00403D6FCE